MKVALVHDWLVEDAGAEKVLKAFIDIYPDADIFSLVDFLNDKDRKSILNSKIVTTSFIQKLPFAKKSFRNYLALFPMAIQSFDLSSYDLIISSSWAVAKGVKKTDKQIHISYCHTPIRYAWDMYDEYTSNISIFKKPFVKLTLKYIKKWDISSLDRVDYFIANSKFVQERIKRIYKRDSVVIYPPVDTQNYTLNENKDAFYITASRLVPYKKTKLIVEAFNKMPNKKLVVIGNGQEYEKIASIAQNNIEMLGYQDKEVLTKYIQKAKAFVYAAVEDFGILPVEALAAGTPVIALNKGGTAETVAHKINGFHFEEQNIFNIINAIEEFEKLSFNAKDISLNAQSFCSKRFKNEIISLINKI